VNGLLIPIGVSVIVDPQRHLIIVYCAVDFSAVGHDFGPPPHAVVGVVVNPRACVVQTLLSLARLNAPVAVCPLLGRDRDLSRESSIRSRISWRDGILVEKLGRPGVRACVCIGVSIAARYCIAITVSETNLDPLDTGRNTSSIMRSETY